MNAEGPTNMGAAAYAKEADLVYDIRQHYSRGDCRLFRNNVGAYQDARGNWVAYGLAVGTSDLIGWQRRVIAPADVGSEWAVFVALECKRAGQYPTDSQQAFLDLVKTHGGVAGVVRSMSDAHRILGY